MSVPRTTAEYEAYEKARRQKLRIPNFFDATPSIAMRDAMEFGLGDKGSTSPLETEGRAKAEAALIVAEAEHSSITCEAEQHAQLIKWAKFNGIVYRHSPMDRKHFEGNGEPDFWFAKSGKVCCVEMKFGTNEPTKAQCERIEELNRADVPADWFKTVASAIVFVTKHLLNDEI